MTACADLEISLHQRAGADAGYTVALRFSRPDSAADIRLLPDAPASAQFDLEQLQRLVLDPAGYGQALGASLLAAPAVRSAFDQARRTAEALNVPLRLRLLLGAGATDLHTLRWETLRDPQSGAGLLTSERILFSRYLSSEDARPVPVRPPGQLRALVAIANPADLADFRPGGQALTPFDVPGELARARASLGDGALTTLTPAGSVSMNAICDRLRSGCAICYLVAHGALRQGKPYLWMEDANGLAAIVAGSELVTRLGELPQPPGLVVLASCQSAGVLAALGPTLATAGVPAVLAMQGDVAIATLEQFMPVFFRELQRDGVVDRAVAVARGAVRDCLDWWMPVLFMRLRDGQLWRGEPDASTNTVVNTGGGDYAGGNIHKQEGVCISGGTVQGGIHYHEDDHS